MTNKIEIRSNPKLTPTFAKGKLVCLTKDLYSQSDIANNFHPAKKYFKENCLFDVIECGLSKCFISKTRAIINPVADEELCAVEVISEELDELDYIQDFVKAKDLRTCTFEDLK